MAAHDFRRISVALLALAVASTLTACESAALPDPPAEPLPTTVAPTPTTAAPTVSPTAGAVVIDVDCADLVDPDVIYEFNPTLALVGSADSAASDAAGLALAAGGIACRWVLESGAADAVVSVAHLSEADLSAQRAAAGQAIPGAAVESYFASTPEAGTVTAFDGSYWIVVTSPLISAPDDVAALVGSVVSALPPA